MGTIREERGLNKLRFGGLYGTELVSSSRYGGEAFDGDGAEKYFDPDSRERSPASPSMAVSRGPFAFFG